MMFSEVSAKNPLSLDHWIPKTPGPTRALVGSGRAKQTPLLFPDDGVGGLPEVTSGETGSFHLPSKVPAIATTKY